MNEIRLGYACLNTELRDYDVFTSRTMRLATVNDKGFDFVRQLVEKNVDDLFKILIFNEAHGIRFYRISSNVFPHLSNPKLVDSNYNLDFIKDKLKMIGKYAKTHQHRLTLHPGQYIQLASPNPEVVKQAIIELQNHVTLLEMLGYTPADGSVLIIHGGGVFGDKAGTLARWRENFMSMPKNIRDFVSLENDENSYNINDLLPLCEELNIPFCLDIFHNRISKPKIPITVNLLKRIFNTWKRRSIIPKMHISEQQIGLRRGAHSKTIDSLPSFVLKIPATFGISIDIMLEVKDKEVSVFKIYYKYFDIKIDKTGRVSYVLKQ